MKHLITLVLLCVASTAFAQIKMQGVVKDSSGVALELANVIAMNDSTKTLESFAVTNDKGRYNLSLSN